MAKEHLRDKAVRTAFAEIERNKFKLQQNFYGDGYSIDNAYRRGIEDAIQFVFEVLNEKLGGCNG